MANGFEAGNQTKILNRYAPPINYASGATANSLAYDGGLLNVVFKLD